MSKIFKKVVRRLISLGVVFVVNKYFKEETIELLKFLWNNRLAIIGGITVAGVIFSITILVYFVVIYLVKGEDFFDNVEDLIFKMINVIKQIQKWMKNLVCP